MSQSESYDPSPDSKRVYIVNYVGHPYDPAKVYGRLVTVIQGSTAGLTTKRLEANIHSILMDSEPHDYLLLSGSLLANALAVTYMLKKHGTARLLIWDTVLRDYDLYETDGSHVEL